MTKVNAKTIREEARKDFMRKHNVELERLREANRELLVRLKLTGDACYKAVQENEKLKEQVRLQKEWIERLMDFINMPEDDRHAAVQEYAVNKQVTEEFEELFAPYYKVLNRLNNVFSL